MLFDFLIFNFYSFFTFIYFYKSSISFFLIMFLIFENIAQVGLVSPKIRGVLPIRGGGSWPTPW